MHKSLIVLLVAGSLLALAAVFLRQSSGTDSRDMPSYVVPEAARAYQEFNQTLATDEEAALKALDSAEKASPGNALHDYLRAVVMVKKKDFAQATALLKESRTKEKLVLHTEFPMPAPLDSANVLRRLAVPFTALSSLKKEEAEAYLDEVLAAGYRITGSEPMEALGALHAVRMILASAESKRSLALLQGRKEDGARADKLVRELTDWMADFKKEIAPDSAIHEVARVSGVDPEIVSNYMARVEIKDAAVRRKLEEANAKVYQQELEKLKKVLATLPGRPEPSVKS